MRRRTLAMVATEAAMAREQDPARYARLERRNAMLVPDGLFGPSPFVGHGVADARWLQQVDAGEWMPDQLFSNCLGLAPLDHVTLIVAAGGLQVMQLALSESAAGPTMWDFDMPVMMTADNGSQGDNGNQLELCALGGRAVVQLVVDLPEPRGSARNPRRPPPPWEAAYDLRLNRTQITFNLQEGVPTLQTVEGILVRLGAVATPQQRPLVGCFAAGAGWNCCVCGVNNHDLRNGCRECKHERCDALAAEARR